MGMLMDFSLQRLAIIAWSGSFWNRPAINDLIHEIFDETLLTGEDVDVIIVDLMELAKAELKSKNLPSVLYDRFIQMVLSSGLRVINWYNQTNRKRVLIPFRYTKVFHWTVYGTIDEVKTIENNWLEKLNVMHSDEKICDVYFKTCTCVLKDFINLNAKKIFEFCQKRRLRELFDEKKLDFIVRSVLTLAHPERLNLSEKHKNKLMDKYFPHLNDSKEAFMFSHSVKAGHFTAAQHYWRQLNFLEKEKKGSKAAIECIKTFKAPGKLFKLSFESNGYVDMLVFILTEMTERQRDNFFNEEFRQLKAQEAILNELMSSCGWEHCFFTIFDVIKERKNDDQHFYYKVLEDIIDVLYKKRRIGLDSKYTVYHQMFRVVWEEINRFHSPSLTSEDKDFIEKIFKNFDFVIINLMLEKYSEFRKKFLSIGERQYKKLIRENQFDLLEKFMESVLNSEDERTWFKSQLGDFDYFIHHCKFDIADNLLNWMSSSNEERTKIKFKIDFLSLTAKHFFKEDSKSAVRILTWGFSNEDEKDEYINSFESQKTDWLELIWRQDDEKHFIRSLSKFLNFFFNTEDINIGYKIGKILSEELLRNFFMEIHKELWKTETFGCLVVRKALKTMDELAEFCLPSQDTSKFKTEISQNAKKWLLFLIEDKCCGSLDIFLNWTLGYRIETFHEKEKVSDHRKKRDFVKNFLLSPDGMTIFKIILRSYYEKFKRYLYLWIEWAGGMNKLENYMDELDTPLSDEPSYVNRNYEDLKYVLKKFKRGESASRTVRHHCYLRSKPRRRRSSFSPHSRRSSRSSSRLRPCSLAHSSFSSDYSSSSDGYSLSSDDSSSYYS